MVRAFCIAVLFALAIPLCSSSQGQERRKSAPSGNKATPRAAVAQKKASQIEEGQIPAPKVGQRAPDAAAEAMVQRDVNSSRTRWSFSISFSG